MPKYVYRYQPDSDNRRENLVNDKIWLCSPDQYNDPLPGSQDRGALLGPQRLRWINLRNAQRRYKACGHSNDGQQQWDGN
jgi:hypothetical protein